MSPTASVTAEAAQQADELVTQMIADGDLRAALQVAYEERQAWPDDLSAHRRYHRVLLLMPGQAATLVDHGRRFVDLLLRRDRPGEALRVFKACRVKDPAFHLERASGMLTLCRTQWRSGDAKATLALLAGFDRHYPGDPLIPQAYELAARVLVQGLGRRDMVKPILRTLQKRYPDSPEAREVEWLMRDAPEPI
ncbi:conserved hypothetical protein [Burkholderiales bacterium 8X]|nr:conserved hypothetical protein [Burkholderiales bacterium 8X]